MQVNVRYVLPNVLPNYSHSKLEIMATVKIILRPDRINSQNEHPLWIRVTKDRKSKYVSLDIDLLPEQWDEKNLRVRKSHPNYNRINAFIAQKVSEAQGVAVELETHNKFISSYKIKEALKGKAPVDFFPFADKFVDSFQMMGKIGSYKRAKSVIEKLRKHVNGRHFSFDMLTVSFLKDYEIHLAVKYENKKNTIHANLRLIRTVINNAIREDLLPMELNPFIRHKLKLEKTQRAFLTEEELEKIDALPIEKNYMLNHHRNIYVFSAWVGGLRISDVLQLRWKNFDGKNINICIHKTQTPLSILIPDRALHIINMYKNENCSGNDFIFPVLKISPEEKNPRIIFNAISGATAYTNKNLRKLAELAGIDKHLSFHTSRHTWATRALTKGMAIENVSKLMGHSAIRETQIYTKIVNAQLDKAMQVFN